MKNKRLMKKIHAVLLAASLLIGIMADVDGLAAPAHVKLVEKAATLYIREEEEQTVYEAKTIKVKASSGVKVKKITYASKNKKIAVVSAKGKVQAKGKGNTRIVVTVKYKKSGKTQTKKLSFSAKVDEKNETGEAEEPDLAEDPVEAPDEPEEEKEDRDTVMPVVTSLPVTAPVSPTMPPIRTVSPVTALPAVTSVPAKAPVNTVRPGATPKPIEKPTAKPTTKPAYVTVPDGIYKIGSKVKGGMMLDVSGNAAKDGTNVQIYASNETAAQRFNITHIGSGWHKICCQSSGKALDVTGRVKNQE